MDLLPAISELTFRINVPNTTDKLYLMNPSKIVNILPKLIPNTSSTQSRAPGSPHPLPSRGVPPQPHYPGGAALPGPPGAGSTHPAAHPASPHPGRSLLPLRIFLFLSYRFSRWPFLCFLSFLGSCLIQLMVTFLLNVISLGKMSFQTVFCVVNALAAIGNTYSDYLPFLTMSQCTLGLWFVCTPFPLPSLLEHFCRNIPVMFLNLKLCFAN